MSVRLKVREEKDKDKVMLAFPSSSVPNVNLQDPGSLEDEEPGGHLVQVEDFVDAPDHVSDQEPVVSPRKTEPPAPKRKKDTNAAKTRLKNAYREQREDMKIDPSLDMLANPSVVKDRIKEPEREKSPPVQSRPKDYEEPDPEQHASYPEQNEEYYYSNDPRYQEYEEEPEIDYEAEAKKRMIEMDNMLSELDSLAKRGYKKYIPKEYNHRSDYEEVRSIHARVSKIAKQDAGLNISRKLLIGGVGLVEWLNTSYDPLGAKLVGFSQSIDASITDYDNVLLRCWERYGQNLSDNNPLIELLITLILAAVMYHFTQSWVENLGNSMPQRSKPVSPKRPPEPALDLTGPGMPTPIKTNIRPENGGTKGPAPPMMGALNGMLGQMLGQKGGSGGFSAAMPDMVDTPVASPAPRQTRVVSSPPPEFNIQLPADIFGDSQALQNVEELKGSPNKGETATFQIPSPPQKQKKKRNTKR